MTPEDFEGIWVLEPSTYQGDEPAPLAGVYTVVAEPSGHWFHLRWTDGHGQVLQAGFRGETSLEGGTLHLAVARDGTEMLRARHQLDEGLVLEQDVRTPEGGWVTTRARYHRSDAKQVVVYRRDLKMRKGKIAAQCAHASMGVFFRRQVRQSADLLKIPLDGPMAHWSRGRFAKVVLSVEDEEGLLRIHEEARKRGLPTSLITDAGKTEFHGVPTRTTVAVGPAAIEEIDPITGRDGLVQTKLA